MSRVTVKTKIEVFMRMTFIFNFRFPIRELVFLVRVLEFGRQSVDLHFAQQGFAGVAAEFNLLPGKLLLLLSILQFEASTRFGTPLYSRLKAKTKVNTNRLQGRGRVQFDLAQVD